MSDSNPGLTRREFVRVSGIAMGASTLMGWPLHLLAFRPDITNPLAQYPARDWEKLYRELIAAGRVRQIPVNRITSVISDLVYGTIFTNHLAGRKRTLRRQADDIVDIVFCGILTDHERRTRDEKQ